MLLILHTAGGIASLVAGALSTYYVISKGTAAQGGASRTMKVVAWAVGAASGAASWTFVDEIGYDIATPDGPGTVVGIPFLVAFFDAEGNDYVGWITLPGAIGNVVIWLLVPQVLLALYLRLRTREATPNTSLERTRDR